MSDGSSESPTPSKSSFKFDVKRLTKVERTVGLTSLVFFISLFLPWFGVGYSVYSTSVNGLWHGYMYLTMIICLVLLVYLVVLSGLEKLPFKVPVEHRTALFVSTGIDFLLTLISFLTKPGGTSWQIGAYIGLIASAIAVAPFAIPAIRARIATKS